jgi:uncharacterized membrane protein YkvA (DUF1232 family)
MTDDDQTGDPFPREPFGALIRRMPRYGKLALALGRDPAVSRARRAVFVAGAAYLLSPVDLVPGIIPVLGQLDDLLVIFLAMRVALAGLSPERRRTHLAAAGIEEADFGADLRTLGVTTAWVARRGVHVASRAATVGARAAGRATVAAERAGRSALGAARRRLERRRRPVDDPPA